MGRKVSDEWVVALCANHHRAMHDVGDEEGWWKQRRIDPVSEAERLWQHTRGPERVEVREERQVSRLRASH